MSAGDDQTRVSRRGFLKVCGAAGTGLTLGIFLPACSAGLKSTEGVETAISGAFEPNLYVTIDPEGIVTVTVVRSEMGQGVRTALPMILGEELEVDWSKIRVRQADADLRFEMATGGSQSVLRSWDLLRRAGASAREMLIIAAAGILKVDRSECRASNGAVVHPDRDKIEYKDLVAAAAQLELPKEPPLKDPKDFQIVGTSRPRIDGVDIVTGRAKFGLDVRVPNMKIATLERPPVRDAECGLIHDIETKKIDGVLGTHELDVGVAVVAENSFAALEGQKELRVDWKLGDNAWFETEEYDRRLRAADSAKIVRDDGDVDQVFGTGGRELEAVYELPFLAHAAISPSNCVADVREDRVEVWAPVQLPREAVGAAAAAAGVHPNAVTLHIPLLGSGFGRRLYPDFVYEAVSISKAVGSPIQLLTNRPDDIRHDYFRPGNLHRMRTSIGADGKPSAWSHRIVGPSILAGFQPNTDRPEAYEIAGAADLPYSIPNLRCEFSHVPVPVRLGALRAVSRVNNAFVVESFLDEIAHASGLDPLELRLHLLAEREPFEFEENLLDTARLAGVLELAADKAGWGTTLPEGHVLGIACNAYESCGSYSAQVVEMSTRDTGGVQVHRVVAAIDCGIVVNPDMVTQQIEGGVVFALSMALKQRITFKDGQAQQTGFQDFTPVWFHEAPDVEVYTVPSAEAPGGVGEPGVPPLAPALTNAIFAATGTRIRRLPIQGSDLQKG